MPLQKLYKLHNIIPHSLGTALLLWWAKRTGATVRSSKEVVAGKGLKPPACEFRSEEKRSSKSVSIVRLADCWRWHSRSINEGKTRERDRQLVWRVSVWEAKGKSKLAIFSNIVHSLVSRVSIPASPKMALTSFFIFRSKSAKLKHCFLVLYRINWQVTTVIIVMVLIN